MLVRLEISKQPFESMRFSVLSDLGYKGPVCVEVEDRAYEGPLRRRRASLRQSARFLRQFLPE